MHKRRYCENICFYVLLGPQSHTLACSDIQVLGNMEKTGVLSNFIFFNVFACAPNFLQFPSPD